MHEPPQRQLILKRRDDIPLVKYDALCQAIAEARSTDEVKEIHNGAAALQAYARQANNRALEADALEIRMRATRRLGQMMQEQKETVGLAKGGGGKHGRKRVIEKPTLKDAGIDKNLAHEARKLGSLSEEGFEEAVATARESISRVVKSALRGQKGKVRAQTETPRAANLGAVDNSHEKSRIPKSARLAAVRDPQEEADAPPQPSKDALALIDLLLTVNVDHVIEPFDDLNAEERDVIIDKLQRLHDAITPPIEGEGEGETDENAGNGEDEDVDAESDDLDIPPYLRRR